MFFRDGSSQSDTLLAKLCSPTELGYITTTSSSDAYVEFLSDPTIQKDGFKLEWRASKTYY